MVWSMCSKLLQMGRPSAWRCSWSGLVCRGMSACFYVSAYLRACCSWYLEVVGVGMKEGLGS